MSRAVDPHVLQPDHAPTPFTAEEIRQGCRVGRTIRTLIEVAGEEPVVRAQRFVRADESGSTTERWAESVSGERLGPSEFREGSWLDLQRHASTPADRTLIGSETIELPIGRLDCLRYTVTDGATVETLWFARALPGMPVKSIEVVDGVVATTVTMIENTMPGG